MNVIREQYPTRRCERGPITLAAFADRHGLHLRIVEHWQSDRPFFTADFLPFTEIMTDGGMLAGIGERGHTEGDAIAALCRRISNRRLVSGAWTGERREFDAPTIVST